MAHRCLPGRRATNSVGGVEIRERFAARTVVLTPEHRVLLMKFHFPWRPEDVWITPGGSLEPGETARSAARRELREETGLELAEVGTELWRREHDLSPYDVPILQRERYFLVRVEEFEPRADWLQAGEERDWFRGYRWWPVDDLPDFAEHIAPRRLGELVRQLLRDGPPATPATIPV